MVGYLRSPLLKNDGDEVHDVVRVFGDNLCVGLGVQGSCIRIYNLLKYDVGWIPIKLSSLGECKSAAHRDKSREWNVSKQQWILC